MAPDAKAFDYTVPCSKARDRIKQMALKLHQDLEGTIVGDDPYCWVVPYENQKEARRRVDFAYATLRKFSNYFNSRQPISHFFGFLNRRLKKIEELLREKNQMAGQLAFDFIQPISEAEVEALRNERREILEIKTMVLDSRKYFEIVH
jgi:hypothetical protein